MDGYREGCQIDGWERHEIFTGLATISSQWEMDTSSSICQDYYKLILDFAFGPELGLVILMVNSAPLAWINVRVSYVNTGVSRWVAFIPSNVSPQILFPLNFKACMLFW